MVNLEKIRAKQPKLDEFFPEPHRSPPGKYVDHRRLFYPYCYLEANKTRRVLKRKGFKLDEAGVYVAVEPFDVSVASVSLSGILDADMRTQIPSYFMVQSTPNKKQPPSYITRTITRTINEPKTENASIVQEFGAQRSITFINKPPYCIFENIHDDDEVDVERLFIRELNLRLKDFGRDYSLDKPNVVILAGIGKNNQKILDNTIENSHLTVRDVKHGSSVMILAMLSMALVDWGMKSPDKSLFFICTARLTNDQNSPPSSYILNKIFVDLGWDPAWLGLCCARTGVARKHPTGAVLIEIKPEQYQVALNTIRTQFNKAAEKMITSEENVGLF